MRVSHPTEIWRRNLTTCASKTQTGTQHDGFYGTQVGKWATCQHFQIYRRARLKPRGLKPSSGHQTDDRSSGGRSCPPHLLQNIQNLRVVTFTFVSDQSLFFLSTAFVGWAVISTEWVIETGADLDGPRLAPKTFMHKIGAMSAKHAHSQTGPRCQSSFARTRASRSIATLSGTGESRSANSSADSCLLYEIRSANLAAT